ncbi:MAG TPA: hypothetical protein PLV41_10835 [Miltoncostaeales bacterium]|nr:hypothetical protein [Miltoncostaeales bacterium]
MSTTPRERSDDELVAASMTVPEDFGAIFERHYAVVAAYCRRRTGAQVGAEIAAETSRGPSSISELRPVR